MGGRRRDMDTGVSYTGSFQCHRIRLHGRGREGGGGAKTQKDRSVHLTACSKRPVYGMKLDVIDGEHQSLIFPAWRLVFSVTSEGIVFPEHRVSQNKRKEGVEWTCVTLGPCHRYSWCYDVSNSLERCQVYLAKERRGRDTERENALDRYSPFDRTERIPFSVRKHSNRSGLPLQRRRNRLPKQAQRGFPNKPSIQKTATRASDQL